MYHFLNLALYDDLVKVAVKNKNQQTVNED
jgi:hypothetical protein